MDENQTNIENKFSTNFNTYAKQKTSKVHCKATSGD